MSFLSSLHDLLHPFLLQWGGNNGHENPRLEMEKFLERPPLCFGRVVYAYAAVNDDELSLRVGETLHIYSQVRLFASLRRTGIVLRSVQGTYLHCCAGCNHARWGLFFAATPDIRLDGCRTQQRPRRWDGGWVARGTEPVYSLSSLWSVLMKPLPALATVFH